MHISTKEELRALSDPELGIAVSIYMPTHEAGPETRENHIRFKNRLQEAGAFLKELGYEGGDTDSLLGSAQALVHDEDFWQHQRKGLAMFISINETFQYRLPFAPEELTVVSDRFHLKPLMPLLIDDGRFFILAVNQNNVRLLEATQHSVSEVSLQGVPTSMAEALSQDDDPEPTSATREVLSKPTLLEGDIMKTLASMGLVALLLMACSQTPADNGNGDTPGDPGPNPGTQPGTGTAYTGVFFKTVETDGPYNVIVGTADLTLSDGQVSGELSAYPDSESFPNDTGTLSGTYQEGPPQGDKQSYTVDLTLDFSSAPDYTASGQVYTVAGKLFTEQPMELNKSGSRVGKFILAEQD